MNTLVEKTIDSLINEKKIPDIPDDSILPVPAINKVELYLSMNCNDYCPHCITDSGPGRKEVLHPNDVKKAIDNIAKYSIIKRLNLLMGPGDYHCEPPLTCKKLETMKKPPSVLDANLITSYSECLQGKNQKSLWIQEEKPVELPFGRPSIRLSGGEFFMWPYELDGNVLSAEERLEYQKDLLNTIRRKLPEYDIWILTNGRFAENQSFADTVIESWYGGDISSKGKTRLCISMDIFHQPPKDSTVRDMVRRIWTSCKRIGSSVPFLYGIPNSRIHLLGRAFKNFKVGTFGKEDIKNISKSDINSFEKISVDPVDLIESDGCNEVKGFYFQHEEKGILSHNIVISPEGNLVFCCACLGEYGHFMTEPEKSLKRMIVHPVSRMLRSAATATHLLNTAVKIDPTIKVFGEGDFPAVTGSTCYQMMSGIRVE